MKESLKRSFASLGADGLVALWLGVWWCANLIEAGCTELANDEAYYHMFAQRLAWGYFDHPPVTALLVWLGERLFGGELGVRFFFTVLQPLYLWALWRLVRPADAVRRDATLFVMLSASTLLLQLYGFIAVPDGPLLASSAVFLWTFRNFSEGRRLAWLWMGAAIALMAYSKYHGALVLLFALAANPRLFARPALYASGAVAAVLLVPHLVWQYHHDWASFIYHLSARNSVFRPGYVVEFLANMLVVFNPFLVPIYVQAWRKTRPQSAVGRALKLLPAAFIGFFLLSSLRGYVQPQWVIVSVFGLIYVAFAYVRRHPRTRRYAMAAGGATLLLVAAVRVEMIFNPLGLRFEVFDNSESYGAIAAEAQGRPVVFRHGYAVAAKYAFYTGGEAYCQPNIRYRTHQWQFRDDDSRFAGREVLVECPPPRDSRHDRTRADRPAGERAQLHVVRRSGFPPRAQGRRHDRRNAPARRCGRYAAAPAALFESLRLCDPCGHGAAGRAAVDALEARPLPRRGVPAGGPFHDSGRRRGVARGDLPRAAAALRRAVRGGLRPVPRGLYQLVQRKTRPDGGRGGGIR